VGGGAFSKRLWKSRAISKDLWETCGKVGRGVEASFPQVFHRTVRRGSFIVSGRNECAMLDGCKKGMCPPKPLDQRGHVSRLQIQSAGDPRFVSEIASRCDDFPVVVYVGSRLGAGRKGKGLCLRRSASLGTIWTQAARRPAVIAS